MLTQRRAMTLRSIALTVLLAAITFPVTTVASEDASDDKSDELLMISREFCPACMAARRFFKEHGIQYSEYKLSESEEVRQTFERLGGRGTPLLYMGGKTMNGFHPQRFRRFWAETTGEKLPAN